VVVGPGDDCAVLDLGNARDSILFKTDAVVEGIHFTAETPPEKIGRKALARPLSDIAAMAGIPGAALVTIGLPKDYDLERVEGIYRGLNALAREYDVAIVGGETTTNPGGIFISVALLGKVASGKTLLRRGAQPGDAIFVTGTLGGSLYGKHLDFEPRIREAQWLAGRFHLHSLMDISDGLAGDLRHILKASGVGAELHASAIPISREAKLHARSSGNAKPPLAAALTDGEDFELLFTLPSSQAVPLLDAWKAHFPAIRLSCIGKIHQTPGLRIRDKSGIRTLNDHGYVHLS
jgi:thiamine-monophosphate kinase